jgi:hypothetical protein
MNRTGAFAKPQHQKLAPGGLPSRLAGPERVKWQVHSVPGGTSAVETCG